MTDQDFLAAFEACTLPKPLWTHEAHLRMAWLYLSSGSFDVVLPRVREAIQHYNAAVGGNPNGYHETVTQVYLRLVADRIRAVPEIKTWPEFRERNVELFDRSSPPTLRFYKRETILSDLARSRFVEPDLQPLP